jgi:GNAT superfamily N-acetyltransferase
MDEQLTIRPYRPTDLERAVAMWRDSKQTAFSYVKVQQLYTLEDDRRYFREVIAPECDVWLAVRAAGSGTEDGGSVMGLLAMRDDLIDQLFVGNDAQRQGVGSALLAKARELSPDQLRAYTFQKNGPARAFFEKHGFAVVRTGISPPPENEPDLEYLWRP